MSDEVVDPQAGTLAERSDFLRKWKVTGINGISDINVNSTITLYNDIAKNVVKCDLGTGKNPYCKTSSCVTNWEDAEFTFANGVLTGTVGNQSGAFRITKGKPDRDIQWEFDTRKGRTPAGPGSSWSGTED